MAKPTQRPPLSVAPSGGDAILRRLRWGPAIVAELATEAGLTPNGVRAHLTGLERDGLVRRVGVQRASGAGKPATIYQLAPRAEARFSKAYLPMLLGLVRALAKNEPRSTRAKIYRKVGEELAAAQGTVGGDFEARVAAAVAILERLGAQLKIQRNKKTIIIEGAGCPLGEAVAADDCVCQTNAAMLTTLVGSTVVDRCVRDGRPRCRFEITRLEADPGHYRRQA